MRYVDICIGNEDAEKCPGFKPLNVDVTNTDLELSSYEGILSK